ncbi:10274_t:CDS:2 [Scutellospora calospora]|uniref:10274_t:CDS:1 n=1 Tax=Scutellospora calospora TaxID=85575 RepID=A0ACA9MCD3_9GLOM|nr:10274_t:CDS:2 [Scutellospora calospora]
MSLKDQFSFDLKMIIDLYEDKLLSFDSNLKIYQLLIASTILEQKIGLYKPNNPLALELFELKYMN